MEWLINRRRMMFNRVIPIEYFEFADNRMNEIISFLFGDCKTITNDTLYSGTINGNDNTEVETVLFADNRYYQHRISSKGKSINAVNPRTVNYRLYIDNLWDIDSTTSASSTDEVFSVSAMQTKNKADYTSLISILGDAWTAEKASPTVFTYDSTLNKWYVDFTTTTFCRYIKIIVRAAVGQSINWSLFVKEDSTVYKPIGITLTQIQAVTALDPVANNISSYRSSSFGYNPYLTSFNEFQYFNNCTAITGNYSGGNTGGFISCSNFQSIVLPNSLAHIGDSSFFGTPISSLNLENITYLGRRWCYTGTHITSLYLPSLETTASEWQNAALTYVDIGENATNLQKVLLGNSCVLVCRATTPPTVTANVTAKALYVPAASVDTYKTTTYWSNVASKTYAIEGSYYENHHELDPN